jgi:hypothetical protein
MMPMTLKINNTEFNCRHLAFFKNPGEMDPYLWLFMGCVVDPSEDMIENVLKKDSMEYPLEYEYTDPLTPSIRRGIKGLATIQQYKLTVDNDRLMEFRISGTIKVQTILTIGSP